MTLRADGHYRCDKCGLDLDNGRAEVATKVIGRDPESPRKLRQLHFCVAERDGAPFGCTGNIIGDAALANYNETRTA